MLLHTHLAMRLSGIVQRDANMCSILLSGHTLPYQGYLCVVCRDRPCASIRPPSQKEFGVLCKERPSKYQKENQEHKCLSSKLTCRHEKMQASAC